MAGAFDAAQSRGRCGDAGHGRIKPVRSALFGIAVECFGDELRGAGGARDRSAEPGRKAGRVLPRHRRRIDVALSPQARRRCRVAGGLGLFRLSRRKGPFRPGTICRPCRKPCGQDDRDQAEPGGQAGPWRGPAGGQGYPRDCRNARCAAGPGLCVARAPQRIFRTRSLRCPRPCSRPGSGWISS